MSLRLSVGQPHAVPATGAATVRPTALADRVAILGLTTVWREALTTFVLHAPAILLVACVCIAGPIMLCQFASVVLRLDFYGQASGPFATWLGISQLRGSPVNAVSVWIFVQAGLGGIGLAFARGVIARLAVSNTGGALGLGLACQEAKAHFPSLLAGSLLYGAFVTFGAVGINAVLSDTEFDLSLVGQRSMTVQGHARLLALRALDAFVPSPGSPFVEFVPLLRHTAFEPFTQVVATGVQGLEGYGIDKVSVKTRPDLQWLIALASVSLLVLAEALLRFTPIMAMNSRERTRLAAVTPVLRSIRFGIRHFGAITMHVWLLRLAFVAGYSVFFILPVVLSQDVAPPIVANVARSVLGQWPVLLTLMCHAFITALFVAFSAVYDARLAMQLNPRIFSHSSFDDSHLVFGANLAHASYDGFGLVKHPFQEEQHEDRA